MPPLAPFRAKQKNTELPVPNETLQGFQGVWGGAVPVVRESIERMTRAAMIGQGGGMFSCIEVQNELLNLNM